MTTTGLTVRIWNDAGIGRRDGDGYINATAMCQANGREWFTYARSDRAQEYIQALASTLGVAPEALIDIRQGGTPELQGTWIHPRLAVDLARTLGPRFAVWMDGWFLESITTHRQQPPQLTRKTSYNRPAHTWTNRERLAVISDPDRRDRALQRIARAALVRQLQYVEPREAIQWRPFGRCPITSREMAALLDYGANIYDLGAMVPSVRPDGPGRLLVNLDACQAFTGLDDDPRNAAQILDDVREAMDEPSRIPMIPGMLRQMEAKLPIWAMGA